jgi:CheY-like chemotaxis protein
VLVVDDDDDVRTTVQRMLEVRGMTVTSAASGPAALERLERDSPDVVVVDYMMPGMDGLEVIRKIKASLPTSSSS